MYFYYICLKGLFVQLFLFILFIFVKLINLLLFRFQATFYFCIFSANSLQHINTNNIVKCSRLHDYSKSENLNLQNKYLKGYNLKSNKYYL